MTGGASGAASRLPLTYVLPLRLGDDADVEELAGYLEHVARHVDQVVVVDGSSPAARARHRARFGPAVEVIAPRHHTRNGKVGGVMTGIDAARHEHVVLADDDVRYERAELAALVERLAGYEVVRPQNHFSPLPWHARLDTARTLLNRALDGDWPGTLAVRRSALRATGGYSGDVLFENLELVRTIEAAGGRQLVARDVLVRRLPPTTAHFRGQQVRQAYDELARPARLVVSLALAPGALVLVRGRHWRALAAAVLAVAAVAEAGRRRAGGRRVYPPSAALLAPLWACWRSLCTWAALGAWVRGGARYRGARLRVAATPRRRLARRLGSGPVERQAPDPLGFAAASAGAR